MTRFQNARQSFQNQLQSVVQGLLFISKQKIKQSTTCSLCSKPSQRRKRLQDLFHLLSRKETRLLLEVFTKRFTGGRNLSLNERPAYFVENHAARTPIDSMDDGLDSTSRGRFTDTKNNFDIWLHHRTRCTVEWSESISAS